MLKLNAEFIHLSSKLQSRDFEIGEISQVKAQDCKRDEAAVAFGHKQ